MQKHYKLGMHTSGLLAWSTNPKQMHEVLLSATVQFCSHCTGDNVARHYNNLLVLMQQVGKLKVEEENIFAEDFFFFLRGINHACFHHVHEEKT